MIDNFALGLAHGLMLLAAWRLLRLEAVDRESGPDGKAAAQRGRFGRRDA